MTVLFKGIIPALITPMTASEEVDEAGLRALIERLIEAGVHALFVLGTNGEFIALNEAEKLRIAKIAVDQARSRVPVIAGTGAYATRDVIDLNSKMLDVGVDAVSVITPYFNGATQPELFTHYERIARATTLPVMLYTIPAKAGITLTVDTVRRLAEIPNIRGIKDSGGDFDRLLQLINLRRDDFAVFTGTDSMILWTLIAGGDGAVAATTVDMVPEGGASAQTGRVFGSARRRSSLPVHLDRVLTQASNLLASREPAPGLHAALHGLVEIVDALRGEGRQARGAARAAVVARLVDADAELMALVRSVAGPYLEELGGSADLELAPFRARMTEASYVKARASCVDRFLRERYRLPTVRFD